jgi:tRNA/tmRNA/rRNA uracil-C5-methylase (TrmA/RlmC/RlmD family)
MPAPESVGRTMSEPSVAVGDLVRLEVGPIAHGGHCVARHDGQVVFVRHTLPGEEITAQITSVGAKFLRADAVEIHQASPDRVEPPCPFSGPGRCGGCDFQHVALGAQRRLKSQVLAEQMRRLAGRDDVIEIEAVDNPRHAPDDGLGWRTRVTFAGAADNRLGLRKHRSHEVLPITHCPIAVDEINAMEIFQQPWGNDVAIQVVSTSTGDEAVLVEEDKRTHLLTGEPILSEQVGDQRYLVRADGFWQVHPGAPATLTAAVLAGIDPQPGQHVIDLYAGSGLFSAPLGERVGATGRVDSVEGERRAVSAARRTLAPMEWVRIHEGDVLQVLRMMRWRHCDAVVLDPPRTGAGEQVIKEIARIEPAKIVYVACDPAAFARDVAYLATAGYRLESARAFDLFPMTHHLETVGLFLRA